MPSPAYPTVDEWAHKRVVPVVLDEDTVVDFKLPDLGVWIAAGKIPNPLRAMAEKVDTQVVDIAELSDEERIEFYELQAFVVATHLVQPDLLEAFADDEEPEEAAMAWVLAEMPPEHRHVIFARAFHVDVGGLLKSLEDLLPFRDGKATTDAGGDREGVTAAAE